MNEANGTRKSRNAKLLPAWRDGGRTWGNAGEQAQFQALRNAVTSSGRKPLLRPRLRRHGRSIGADQLGEAGVLAGR